MADKKEPKFTPLDQLPAPEFPKPKEGRPTKYRPEFCNMVIEADPIRSAGATDSAIAQHLGVDRVTVFRWREEHPEFAAACEEAKRVADDRVEQSLFARATGYDNPKAVKIFMPQGAEEPVYAPFTEHYPPDVGAAFNWLKNRRPKDWRDRVEHTGADGKDLPAPATIDVMELARQMALGLEIARRRVTEAGSGGKVIEGSAEAGEAGARPGSTSGDLGPEKA